MTRKLFHAMLRAAGNSFVDTRIPWDLTTFEYSGKSLDMSGQDTSTRGIFIGDDGNKLYMAGTGNDRIYQYNLATPWDISTGVFSQFYSVGAESAFPYDVTFDVTGTRMMVASPNGALVQYRVYQYTVSTPWDISTASYINFYDVSAEDTSNSMNMFFAGNYDLKFYLSRFGPNGIYQYTTDTVNSVFNASYDNVFLGVAGQVNSIRGIHFSLDGTKLFVIDNDTISKVHRYDLSTPWSIASVTYVGFLDTSTEVSSPVGIFANPNGFSIYVHSFSTDTVYEYIATQN